MPTRDMTVQNPISRIWDIVEKAPVGMLTTQFGGGLRARPLQARPTMSGWSLSMRVIIAPISPSPGARS